MQDARNEENTIYVQLFSFQNYHELNLHRIVMIVALSIFKSHACPSLLLLEFK